MNEEKFSETNYVKVLNSRIKDLEAEIYQTKQSFENAKLFAGHLEDRIAGLEVQLQKEKEKLEKFNVTKDPNLNKLEEAVVDHYDEKIDNNNEKISELQEDIKGLEDLRGKLESNSEKKRIYKKIENKRKRIQELKDKNVKFSTRQRTVLVAKEKVSSLKDSILSNQEGKVNVAQQKLNDVEAVRETLGREAVDGIVDKAYAIKGMYYKIKLGYRTTVLETMKKANQIFIKGAKDVLIPKNITEQMEISMLDKNEQKEVDQATEQIPGTGSDQADLNAVVEQIPAEEQKEVAAAAKALIGG